VASLLFRKSKRGSIVETADLEAAVRALTARLESITARLDHMEAQAAAGFKQTGQNVKYTLWSDAQSSADGVPGVPDAVVDAVRAGKTSRPSRATET
jgi:hypothetical protein